MLSTDEFAEWSTKVALFVHNSSRIDDEPFPDLLREKGGNAFPTVSFLDAEGALLLQVGGAPTVEELEAGYRRLAAWRELRAAVDGGATERAKQLFVTELDLGLLDFAAAQSAFASFEFPAAEVAALQQQLVNLEFRDILRATARSEMITGGEAFLAMYRADRIPDSAQDTTFWEFMFAAAEARADPPLFAELMADVKKRKAGDRRLKRYLASLEQRLAKLQSKTDG
ncbi:MAG: hypothetical protein AAF628_11815 [Planctomycetota bacterium]